MTYRLDKEANGARRRRACFAAHRNYIPDEALFQGATGERDALERRRRGEEHAKGRVGRLVGGTDAFFVSGGGERPREAVKDECGDNDR